MSVEGTHEIRIEATAVATPQPTTVAEAFLALLASRGVEYLFFNAGTDFAPISEAYARGARQGLPAPQSVLVPHENGAVAMAHGYTMVTGRPQAVMVHVGPGTANALNGIFNAARQNVPMLVAAGRTPILESGALGARNLTIHWAQEQFDQAGMLREFVKWDYELRHPAQIETVVDRALAIAASPPRGPVYLTLPREVIAAPFGDRPLAARATLAAASPPAPAPSELDDAAQLLARARSPLLITSNAGRTVAAARALKSGVPGVLEAAVECREGDVGEER